MSLVLKGTYCPLVPKYKEKEVGVSQFLGSIEGTFSDNFVYNYDLIVSF